jgi:hypothetical protein
MPAAESLVEGQFGRAEALLMRIRTLKWHAITIQSSAKTDARRAEAAKAVDELDEVEFGLQSDRSEASITAAEVRVDEIGGRFVDMGPAL